MGKKSPLLKVGGNKRQRADRRVRRGLRRTERSQMELEGGAEDKSTDKEVGGGTDEQRKGQEIQGRGVLYENRRCRSSPGKRIRAFFW